MRVLSTSALALAAAAMLVAGSATATMPQDTGNSDTSWTADKPLTGHALPCTDGKIKSFSCHNVELLSFLPKSALANSTGTDLWGWHDSTTKREFALIGGQSTAFIDVTDPVNPKSPTTSATSISTTKWTRASWRSRSDVIASVRGRSAST